MQTGVTLPPEHTPVAAGDARIGKYLVFQLGREEFAIGVLKVREIIGVPEVTAVPQTPAHVKGVINLRGKVVPVVDLRLKFGLREIEYTEHTCTIVIQAHTDANSRLTGIVVDGVVEVLNVAAEDLENTPDFGQAAASRYLLGMAKIKGKVKLLLDIDHILNGSAASDLKAVFGDQLREERAGA